MHFAIRIDTVHRLEGLIYGFVAEISRVAEVDSSLLVNRDVVRRIKRAAFEQARQDFGLAGLHVGASYTPTSEVGALGRKHVLPVVVTRDSVQPSLPTDLGGLTSFRATVNKGTPVEGQIATVCGKLLAHMAQHYRKPGLGLLPSSALAIGYVENFIQRVSTGQPATITLNAYPDWSIPAHVIAIIPTADRAKATVKVRVGFAVGDPRILPEMGARVAFHDSKAPRDSTAASAVAQQPVLVPKEAVQADGDTGVVFVIADGGVERRTVRLGGQSAAGQIVLAGLKAGTRLARGDLSSLADGSKVRVEE